MNWILVMQICRLHKPTEENRRATAKARARLTKGARNPSSIQG